MIQRGRLEKAALVMYSKNGFSYYILLLLMTKLFPFILSVLFFSCQVNNGNYPTDYDAEIVSREIASHDTTIIFVGTSWCQGSMHSFQEYVTPYLNKKHDNLGFVFIYFGDIDDIPEEIVQQYLVMIAPSNKGLDKIIINRMLKGLLNDYRKQSGVPITLLVDKEGNIMNYDESKNRYTSFGEVVWRIENRTTN